MRGRRSRLGAAIGLVALCSGLTLVGWQRVEAQPADVLSLPGDAPGSKVAFHRRADLATSGSQEQKTFEFPNAAEVRIETVSARCDVRDTQVVSVELITSIVDPDADSFIVFHEIALTRVGTFVPSDHKRRALYTGTHYVRLLAKGNFGSPTGPPEFTVLVQRFGGEPELPGNLDCTVTVAGYTTPAVGTGQ